MSIYRNMVEDKLRRELVCARKTQTVATQAIVEILGELDRRKGEPVTITVTLTPDAADAILGNWGLLKRGDDRLYESAAKIAEAVRAARTET